VFKENRNLYHVVKKIANIDILNDIKKKDCEWKSRKDKNDKKFDNEKTAEDDISDVKFVNMTSMKLFKYANLFINKTFNNFLWKSVIYDSNYNDSLIYDLNWFVKWNDVCARNDQYVKRFYVDQRIWNNARH
jgi:hypothetical protein